MHYWEDMGGNPNSRYKYLADPISSLLIVILIISSAVPLLKECVHILLQAVPTAYSMDVIKNELLNINGLLGVHDTHLWQLSSDINILTSHLECDISYDFMSISDQAKKILHNHNIHSSTLQPEYCDDDCNHRLEDDGGELGEKDNDNDNKYVINESDHKKTRCHDLICDDINCRNKSCC